MTFVYDIYVNFQNICYDFYEWNKKDKIMHVKKIPIFEITEENFGKIIINDNKIDNTIFFFSNSVNSRFKKSILWILFKMVFSSSSNRKDFFIILPSF